MKNRPPSQNIIHHLKLKSNKSRFNLASFLELRTNELDLVYWQVEGLMAHKRKKQETKYVKTCNTFKINFDISDGRWPFMEYLIPIIYGFHA